MSNYAVAALSLIAGVFLCGYFTSPNIILLFSFVIILIIAIYIIGKLLRKISSNHIIIGVLFFLIGTLLILFSHDMKDSNAYKFLGSDVSIKGIITELPVRQGNNYKYVISADSVTANGETVNVSDKIRLTTPAVFEYGSAISCNGTLKAFQSRQNETGFDSQLYYRTKGINFRLYDETPQAISGIRQKASFYNLSNKVRWEISKFIDTYFTGDTNALLKAVITGNKSEFSERFDDALLSTGLRRFVYPAFLHIAIISWIIGLLSEFVPKKRRDLILIAFLVLYGLANSNQPIFLKACLGSIVAILLKKHQGWSDPLDVVSLIILIIGISNPLMLYDSGLIISFTNSILMSFFFRYLYDKATFLRNRNIRRIFVLWIINSVLLSPVLACFGGGIGIYAIWASIVIIPLIISILVLSPVMFIITAIFPNFSFVLMIPEKLAILIQYIVGVINRLPLSSISLPCPTFIFMLGYTFIILGIRCSMLKNHIYKRLFMSACVCCMLIFSCGQLYRIGTLELTFVNVGQGDGALLRTPFRQTFIVDGGGGAPYSDYNIGKNVFVPYLQSKGVYSIDAAFLSHFDKDHAEGIEAAIKSLHVKAVYVPDYPKECEWRTRIEAAASDNDTKIIYVTENSSISFSGGLSARIIPPEKTAASTNDGSMIMYWDFFGTSSLFTGDVSTKRLQQLTDSGFIEESQILKVPHHGSKKSVCEAFTHKVKPKYSVFSLGEDNTYGFPTKEALDTYTGVCSQILRTDLNGDIHINIDKKGVRSVKTYK